MNTSLNKIFEILGLLYISNHPEFIEKEHVLKSVSEFGINGDELYKKFSNIHKRYVTAFQKELVLNKEDTFFFDDDDSDFILILQIICADNPHWIDNIDSISEDEIFMVFINAIAEDETVEVKPSLSETIELLKSVGLSPNMCWKLMLLLQEPKKQIEHLTYIVKQNIPAYEHAILSVEKPLKRLLEEFSKSQYKLTSILKQENQEIVITPTLIYPAVEILGTDRNGYSYRYVGLFTKEIYKMMDNLKISRNNLIPILKILSDSSKFDILVSLKISPKYNMELAEQLGLTAATISHHMNVLLTHDFVSVEKRDGRVYYTLVKDTIENIISELQYTFST